VACAGDAYGKVVGQGQEKEGSIFYIDRIAISASIKHVTISKRYPCLLAK
jgi:hypothetical protein